VLLQESSDRRPLDPQGVREHQVFQVTQQVHDEAEFDRVLASGEVLFAIEIPANFERACGVARRRRCWWRPTRPILWRRARRWRPCPGWCRRRWRTTAAARSIRAAVRGAHAFPLQPGGGDSAQYRAGLVGTILTMTMLIFTALSVTREIERGTMESLLSMPITPFEIMIGKIVPYIIVGFVQASLIIGIGIGLFGVPVLGSLTLLAALSTLFIAANLAIGYTFSTIAQNQLQAMQMSMMFFLPNILLSGFMFRLPACRSGRNGSASFCRSRIIIASCARSCSRARRCRPALRYAGARRLMLFAMRSP
jgi:ABC-2 type transport system permease protein